MEYNGPNFHIFDNYKEYKSGYSERNEFLMVCKKFYSKEDFEHCSDVSTNALYICWSNNILIDEYFIQGVALGHDLLEDTDFLHSEYADKLSTDMEYCLSALTRKENQTYEDYITEIASYTNKTSEFKTLAEAVYIVKLADLIDHLMRYKTLTDSLKKRYLKALDIMLQKEN